jgi:hypothetical protein
MSQRRAMNENGVYYHQECLEDEPLQMQKRGEGTAEGEVGR